MNPIDKFYDTATRQFTDRQKPRALFEQTLKNLQRSTCISYYGDGGIGKTRLLTKLMQEAHIHTNNPVTLFINFEESSFRNIGEFLNTLKFQLLEEEKVNFYSFELAYSIYYAKTQPGEMPLQKAQTFIPEDHLLYDIIDNLEGIPYAGLVPRAISLMSKIPQHTKKANWWKQTGNTLAAKLQNISDIQMLRDILVELWVNDVKTHFTNSDRNIIFFFDSFETLDLTRLPRVKTLMYQFADYPVLFIIGSRNKLNWSTTEQLLVDEHIVGELSEEDIRSFLYSCHIGCANIQCSCTNAALEHAALNEEIVQKIIEISNGIPIYLDLMVDTYIQIKKEQQPLLKHFTDNQHDIVPLLLSHFKESELAFLELMSFPSYWNYDITKLLFNEFNPGIRLSQSEQFYEYSFIDSYNSEHIIMQSFVRNWLQQHVKQSSIRYFEDVHSYLFSYFDDKFKANARYEDFKEAALHGENGLKQQPFEKWLEEAIPILLNKGYHEDVLPYLENLYDRYTFSKQAQAFVMLTIVQCSQLLGQYEKVVNYATPAINLANELEQKDLLAQIQASLAASYLAQSNYNEAIKFYRLASVNYNDVLKTIDALTKIGKISVITSDFETAKESYLEASKYIHSLLNEQNEQTELLVLAGQCYEKLGELMDYSGRYEEQHRLYKQSIHFLERAVTNDKHPNYLQHVTLLGFSYKRFAESHEMLKLDAIPIFNKAIAYYKQVLESLPNSIDTLEKLGHACADLMRVARNANDIEQFQTAFDEGIKAFSTVIAITPNQGSSLNRLSSLNLQMADYYIDAEDKALAQTFLQEAERFYALTIERTPNYAYAPNKRKELDVAQLKFNELS